MRSRGRIGRRVDELRRRERATASVLEGDAHLGDRKGAPFGRLARRLRRLRALGEGAHHPSVERRLPAQRSYARTSAEARARRRRRGAGAGCWTGAAALAGVRPPGLLRRRGFRRGPWRSPAASPPGSRRAACYEPIGGETPQQHDAAPAFNDTSRRTRSAISSGRHSCRHGLRRHFAGAERFSDVGAGSSSASVVPWIEVDHLVLHWSKNGAYSPGTCKRIACGQPHRALRVARHSGSARRIEHHPAAPTASRPR